MTLRLLASRKESCSSVAISTPNKMKMVTSGEHLENVATANFPFIPGANQNTGNIAAFRFLGLSFAPSIGQYLPSGGYRPSNENLGFSFAPGISGLCHSSPPSFRSSPQKYLLLDLDFDLDQGKFTSCSSLNRVRSQRAGISEATKRE